MATRSRAQVPGGVPVTGRAQTATSENVIWTPRRGARHQATIRTTLWRHETPHRHHGTGAPQAAFVHCLPCSFGIPLRRRMGATLFPAATSEPLPLFRAHAHSVLQSLAGEPQAAPVSPHSAFAVTPPVHARTVKAAGRLRVDRASHAPFFAQMQIKSSLCLRKSRSCNRSRLRHERAGARAHIYTYADA